MKTWDDLIDDRSFENAGDYKRTPDGTILSPGKFEGQPWYVPYYWELGCADDMDGDAHVYHVTRAERKAFKPLLHGRKKVKLVEDDDGNVMEV